AGVDLNRNFPLHHRRRARWLDWWPMWNPGPEPASEPETRALSDLFGTVRPSVALSLHSFGRWFFYPPAAHRSPDPGSAAHARCLAAARAPGYRSAQLGRWAWWFRAYGTEIDTLADRGALAFLVEISRGGIGKWPGSRLLDPFCLFNPPDPEPETARLLPALRTLLQTALTEEYPVQGRNWKT
ncbi:MAG: hypothetical protein KC729_06855, partial [Candidatus Eisenbacteria bacterium]|nr:hypothetical protein [Candidatus Eisenbacteria bacterium]